MTDKPNTLTLGQLLSEADTAGHDHATADHGNGLQHIHNHATGAVVWFPTWEKNRETVEWDAGMKEFDTQLDFTAAASGGSVADAASKLLAERLAALLDAAAAAPDSSVFVQENLTRHLTQTWMLGDAYALKSGGGLPSGTPASEFAEYPYDVYGQDGGNFATALWNDLIDARRNLALGEEAARKALKPVSRKALKNAARKAGKRWDTAART
ncbi:hypothetical protein [Pseudarthrobacter sp. N5]|uniref:hypothetical protein n=1 Tax=Pseudarthrobacter sp. N5 TaxID=3418416 RepID=UPI003CF94D73